MIRMLKLIKRCSFINRYSYRQIGNANIRKTTNVVTGTLNAQCGAIQVDQVERATIKSSKDKSHPVCICCMQIAVPLFGI